MNIALNYILSYHNICIAIAENFEKALFGNFGKVMI